uniref:Folliculin n=1 Tax=Ciona savignyi TaxID=51511 RepID=H2YJQ8_CIOSA
MEAVMALCHFCEQHGPSVMFTCEKVLNQCKQYTNTPDIPSEGKDFEPTHGNATPIDSHHPPLSMRKTDLCQACRSLPESDKGFISCDDENGMNFISTQHPHNPEVFRLVRQACVRSLSCEVCPGREGPIMFGDDKHGYVISYTFYVQDNLARGLKRWYSIICIMTDRVFLIQSWPFLVGCIQKIIKYMQRCADAIYKIESSEAPQYRSKYTPRSGHVVTPHNFRQHRGDNSNARALIQLTGNPDLYPYLHTAFTWVMQACRKRFKEKIVEGPKLDDEISDSDQYSVRTRLETPANLASPNSSGGNPIFKSLRHMREVMQPHWFKAIAWHLLIGNQVVWKGDDKELITSALNVLKDLLPHGCVKLLTNSDQYVNCSKANLLGLTEAAIIPALNVRCSENFILVETVRKNHPKSNQLYPSLEPGNIMNGVEFKVTNRCVIPEKGPEILNKLEVAIANISLSAEVVKHCLICMKEEWMNKAKILYKFTMVDNRDKEDTNWLIHECLQCGDDDLRLLTFWLTALTPQFKEDMRKSILLPE